jgi:CHAT domain-containing protein
MAWGEGPLSLGRAFLQAGAGAVVATLWPVGDGAADLMAAFHRALDGGRTPAEALRFAKLELRGRGVSPLVWAPFVLLAGTR